MNKLSELDESTANRGFGQGPDGAQDQTMRRLLSEQQTILNNVLDGIVYLKHRRIVSCNRRMNDIFGYLPGELIGQSTEILYASRQIFLEVGKTAYSQCAAGKTHSDEVLMRRKDGQTFWGNLRGQAIDPRRVHQGSIWIFTDISERRAAEQQTRKLLRAVEQSPVSIVITDCDGVIEYVNPRFTQVTGYSRHEAVGCNPRILKSNRTPKEIYAEMWESLLAGSEWRGELCNRRKNGELFWEDASISPIIDEQGKITHFLAVKEDISARKRDEDALRQSYALLELTGRLGRIGGWSCDVQSGSISWTDEVFRIHDLAPGTPPDPRTSLNFYTPESRPLILAAIKSAIEDSTPWDLEVELCTAAGRLIWVRAQGRAERDPLTGKTIRLYGVLQDISEQRAVKAQLEEYQLHLEEVVERRTADLASALEAAKVADKVKDSFLANVSHELRTPLNAVIGLTALALKDCQDDRQREYLEKVNSSGETLLAIINDLLDLSKIATGEMHFEALPFRLREIVARALSSIGHRAVEKCLHLDSQIDDRLPEVMVGDPLRVEQILLNLLNNAIKFTDSGGVALRVGLSDGDGQHVKVLIEVEDSGIGMREEDLARIYQPFVQADPSITRKHGGTGLGLAICKRLAEGMGGHIAVNSRLGHGTCFSVVLYFGLQDESELPSSESVDVSPELPTRYRDARVLVIDDQPLNREIVVELLASVGIVPRLVENGREALEIVSAGQPGDFDLLLMDIQMPVMDGLTATRRIRALPGFASLPIVAMTAHTMIHEKQSYLSDGMMNDHIGKPFSMAHFFKVLAKWLPQRVESKPAVQVVRDVSAGQVLPYIAGVDSVEALDRFAGNQERYRYWLRRFVDESVHFLPTVERLLNAGDHQRARQTAHAFKGRVGMLGLRELHGLAGAFERMILERQPLGDLRRKIARVIDDLRGKLRSALGDAVDQEPVGLVATPAPLPEGPPPAVIVDLCGLLDQADGSSVTVIDEALSTLSDSAWGATLKAARALVMQFDFDAARRLFPRFP
ncbi:MAG: PAS domain S-box protein [Candidatus Accumulibacter sp.]|nr:PAS domain S-box protein [Accumulibacter sp.]